MVIAHELQPQDIANNIPRDNEKPPRNIVVPAFSAQARPITNEDVSDHRTWDFAFVDRTTVRSVPRANT